MAISKDSQSPQSLTIAGCSDCIAVETTSSASFDNSFDSHPTLSLLLLSTSNVRNITCRIADTVIEMAAMNV
ncbi:unnamed protein product [Litomosoides sigmodontis]|uniref:Uncharacterized protein n=1 Tax=Litomosoides sigmodontis TaxID=42156 RepID=A0A3P7M6W0_LITSI|nr:unnamed protein product [Litomosoides sigmodontis]